MILLSFRPGRGFELGRLAAVIAFAWSLTRVSRRLRRRLVSGQKKRRRRDSNIAGHTMLRCWRVDMMEKCTRASRKSDGWPGLTWSKTPIFPSSNIRPARRAYCHACFFGRCRIPYSVTMSEGCRPVLMTGQIYGQQAICVLIHY